MSTLRLAIGFAQDIALLLLEMTAASFTTISSQQSFSPRLRDYNLCPTRPLALEFAPLDFHDKEECASRLNADDLRLVRLSALFSSSRRYTTSYFFRTQVIVYLICERRVTFSLILIYT